MKKSKISILILCVTMLVLLAGCFDYDEALVINVDGSGTIQMKIGVDKAYFEQMKAIAVQMAEAMPDAGIDTDPMASLFKKEDIEKTLAEDDSGVALVAYEASETDKSKTWDMKFSFKDYNNIDILDKALSSGGMDFDAYEDTEENNEEPAEEPPLLTKNDDGSWLFYRSFDNMADDEDDEYGEDYDDYGDYDESYEDESDDEFTNPLAEKIEEGLEEYADDLEDQINNSAGSNKMRFSITVFGDIIETNAHTVEGNTATWEYSAEELSNSSIEQTILFK